MRGKTTRDRRAEQRRYLIRFSDGGTGCASTTSRSRPMRLSSDDEPGDDEPRHDIVGDTGPRSSAFDLSAYAGSTIRAEVQATIPQCFTGPGVMAFDNFSLLAQPRSLPQENRRELAAREPVHVRRPFAAIGSSGGR
jgi:hypothetical protein